MIMWSRCELLQESIFRPFLQCMLREFCAPHLYLKWAFQGFQSNLILFLYNWCVRIYILRWEPCEYTKLSALSITWNFVIHNIVYILWSTYLYFHLCYFASTVAGNRTSLSSLYRANYLQINYCLNVVLVSLFSIFI